MPDRRDVGIECGRFRAPALEQRRQIVACIDQRAERNPARQCVDGRTIRELVQRLAPREALRIEIAADLDDPCGGLQRSEYVAIGDEDSRARATLTGVFLELR